MVGQVVLGKYQVLRLLEQGGMSRIYLARQKDKPRDVVVKVLKDHLLSNTKAVEHFRREIHIISRFRHPYAVECCDAAPRAPGGPVLVLEYLRGVDLGQLLHQEGRVTPERAGRLLVQLCDVLQAAHAAGIVHRDLKPGNLMILERGLPGERVKLMDFGLARMQSLLYIGADELMDYAAPTASGTPEYIAPEAASGPDTDARGDVYSTGVLLFEMLAGRRPFVDPSLDRLLAAHLNDPPPTFAEVLGARHGIPPAVEDVVRRCLAKVPGDRPASAQELAAAYEQALGRRLASSRPAAATLGLAPPAAAAPDRSPRAVERNAVRHSVEASMPEAMALLKLRGFVHDLGGEVVDSVPGMIRVRLGEPAPARKSGSLFGLLGGGKAASTPAAPVTDLELHMERQDPAQPGRLTITLVLRSGNGLMTPEWHQRCQQIGRDLQAYLMGR
jgi:tRNA A-37 threonylcarbamoyl transferase component Bud32